MVQKISAYLSVAYLLAVFAHSGNGLAAGEPSTDWYLRAWQTDDGLPSANVTGIAQTKGGFLWLATQSGLARFDGYKMDEVPIPAGHSQPIIRALLCDENERLWLGEDNGIIVRMNGDGSSAVRFTPSDGLSDSSLQQIVETGKHEIWAAFSDGSVCRIGTNGTIKRFFKDEDSLARDESSCSLAIDSNGELWCARNRSVGMFREGHFEPSFRMDERNLQILASRSGGIWVGTPSRIFKCGKDGTKTVLAKFDGAQGRLRLTAMFEDSQRRLWIGSAANGLWLLDGTNLLQVPTSQNNIHTLTQDLEGNIWVGTDGGGVDRLRERVIKLLGRGDGLPFETVRSMGEDSAGVLWVITQDGSVTRLTGEHWTNIEQDFGWSGGSAHCVAVARTGTVWFGTYQHGLYGWKDGKFSRYTVKEGLAGGSVRSLLAARNDDLWIGFEAGIVQRLREGKFETFPLPAGCRPIRAMVEDDTGHIWMGTLNGRLLRLGDRQLEDLTYQLDSSVHPIRCMTWMPDGSLWIGFAAGGMGRLKNGRFSRLTRDQGLYDNNVCAFMRDDNGRMWIAADRGIFYVETSQLNEVADNPSKRLNCSVFGRDDGLPGLQAYYGYSPGAVRTSGGEILFPTHSGIAMVFPKRIRANLVPPLVFIKSVTVGGRPLDFSKAEKNPAHLAAGSRNLELAFTSPSYIGPEQVRFQYRLDGWNDDWSDASGERKVLYPRLPPGDYVFHVRARNSSGIPSESDATFKFVLQPFFWETPAFHILLVVLLAGGLAYLVRHFSLARAREILRRAEQASALQQERERIAQDMHDELGAQFTQISLLGELTRKASNQPEKWAGYVGEISRVAQSGVKSLDEIVWTVNPRNDTLPELMDYTGQYALSFLSAANIHCRLAFPEHLEPREISSKMRHAIFLIVKEALNNVVRHSGASKVQLALECDEQGMRWTIEDNGRGFPKAPDNSHSDGLRNMRHRATALGGDIHFESGQGKGTKILVSFAWLNA